MRWLPRRFVQSWEGDALVTSGRRVGHRPDPGATAQLCARPRREIVRFAACAQDLMDRARVAHLDLSPKNTVIHNGTLKLIDFDVAQLDGAPRTPLLDRRRDHRHDYADFLGAYYDCACGDPDLARGLGAAGRSCQKLWRNDILLRRDAAGTLIYELTGFIPRLNDSAAARTGSPTFPTDWPLRARSGAQGT